jgi:predicted nicotinamide N-methyase
LRGDCHRRDLVIDTAAFIRERLSLQPVAGLPDIRLYTGHAGSRLSQLDTGEAPYWAYTWAGGAVLARHLATHPEVVTGRTVLDLGSGSGLVAIAAAEAGAARVLATDLDMFARAATAINAAENGVAVTVLEAGDAADVALVLAGDVFYGADVAQQSIRTLDAFRARGIAVLVGDPGRRDLPLHLLDEIARYDVADFGTAQGTPVSAAVYTYRA